MSSLTARKGRRQEWSTEFSCVGCTAYTCLCNLCAMADVHEDIEPGSWCGYLLFNIIYTAVGFGSCVVRYAAGQRPRIPSCSAPHHRNARAGCMLCVVVGAQVLPNQVKDREDLVKKYNVYDSNGGYAEFS